MFPNTVSFSATSVVPIPIPDKVCKSSPPIANPLDVESKIELYDIVLDDKSVNNVLLKSILSV